MKYILHNIKQELDSDINNIIKAVAKTIGVTSSDINNLKIVKKSIDARKKSSIHFVYSVTFEIVKSNKVLCETSNLKILAENEQKDIPIGSEKIDGRPIIVGFGPAGMFAGLFLAQKGYKPIVLERGDCVEERTEKVNSFWMNGSLDTNSNVQFGEGGAGTFSDGKLTTRINDPRCDMVLEELHKAGAPEEILYKAKPHIGTDVLRNVVIAIREKIISLGGEIHFNTLVTDLLINNGKIASIKTNTGECFDTSVMILAVGHSARDTFSMLLSKGVVLEPKPFSVGARVEHKQELINRAQYGEYANHPAIGTAEYQLFKKIGDRTAYTFCMCPGGTVVAAASEENSIVTNGMSEFARNLDNANSALVVSVEPKDFDSNHPLAGVFFQQKLEKLAFKEGGSLGAAPVQMVGDFLEGRKTTCLGNVYPSYTGDIRTSNIENCLPKFITDTMRAAIKAFDNSLKGFGLGDAVLTGVETRTSSPVRILRNDELEAIGIEGLYPIGEGAGYAGGIMSAAVDGLRVAEKIVSKYSPV